MIASVGAIDGTAIAAPMTPTTPRPEITPSSAVVIGITIASTVPRTSTRTTIAAPIPTISLSRVLGLESCEPR